MDYKNHVNSMFTFLHSIQSKRCLKIIIVTLLVFVLVSILCAYFVFRPGKPHPSSEQSYFTVVLDCGSTGTRVNVYEWLSNGTKNNQDQPILLHSFPDHSTENSLQKDACLYHCMQTEPGLDKFVQNSSGLRAALDPLLLWAKQQIPSERHKDGFVFVLATAGLRRLPSEDAAWILANAEAILKEYPFAHSKSWVRVLSGQEEAYYGWIALNYKKGTLRGSSRVPTLGVLDMGGSSLQVVMETDESREDQNLVQLKIGPVKHQILAYSLPKFGLNEAFDRTVVMLSEKQSLSESTDGTFQLRHPCLSAGYLLNHTCYGCVQQNVSSWQNLSGQLLSNQSSTFYLIGDPDWEQCKGLAKAAATQSSNTDGLHLSMNMTDKARPISSDGTNSLNITSSLGRGASFHALSGFFAVYSLLGLNPIANLTEFLERGQQICSGSWVNSNIFSGNRKYAEQFCFRVPYLASVIEDYLCMGNAKINFGPGDVSWTLGAALVEGEHTWLSKTEAPAVSFDLKNIEVLSYPTALFFLFLCLLLIIFWGHVKWTAISLVSALGIKGSSIGASLPSYIFPKRNDQADLQRKSNPRIQCSLGEETKYGACFCMRSFGACGTDRNFRSFKGIRSGVTQVILSFDCTVPL